MKAEETQQAEGEGLGEYSVPRTRDAGASRQVAAAQWILRGGGEIREPAQGA